MSDHSLVLPEGWKWSRLGDLAQIKYGRANPKDSGEVPVIGSGGIFSSTRKPLVDYPTLVIGRKGTAGMVWLQEQPCYPSDTTFYLQWTGNDVDCRFLYHRLQYEPLSGEHARTTLPSLQRGDLETYRIPLPPITEQRTIAHALRTTQQAQDTRQRELVLERERKAALTEYLLTHGVHSEPRKQTEIGMLPESWHVLQLSAVARIERGKFQHRPINAPEFYGGGVPFVQTGDVAASGGHITTYTQTLNERGLAISRVFPKGTILITIAANIGYTGILDFDCAVPDSLIGITPTSGIQNEFLNFYLMTQRPEMDRKAPRGTQKNINIEFLKPWPVPVPSHEEQRAIARALRSCDLRIATLESEIRLLNEFFRAMLDELMTGRLSTASLLDVA
jgi:type I restriction enzyme S subunit